MKTGNLFPRDQTQSPNKIEGVQHQALEIGRNRMFVTAGMLALAFVVIGAKLVNLMALENDSEPRLAHSAILTSSRADIVDRNGVILATNLPSALLAVKPPMLLRDGVNIREISEKLASIIPSLNALTVYEDLISDESYIRLAKALTPKQIYEVKRLGVRGLEVRAQEYRAYPHGRLMVHTLGLTDIDGKGIEGVEKYFDYQLRVQREPLRLSIDIRIQDILRTELQASIDEFKAIGGAGVVMDAKTGEIIAMSSLPDFDPRDRSERTKSQTLNRVTSGVYEMGSTFKLFTAAMALDTNTVTMYSSYDASEPIRIARHTIRDFHAKNRRLTIPEIILHSSNIGAAKMAVDVGVESQQDYLERFGLLQAVDFELPEVGKPIVPGVWREINTMTVSYGHGISVNALQLVNGISTLVNGGIRRSPTLLDQHGIVRDGTRVISENTSKNMRQLMRVVVNYGTGKNASAKGYLVGGKTGTADKVVGNSYSNNAKISSFVGAFPINDPKYVLFAMIDEPTGNKRTYNYATGGWVAAPVVKKVIERMAPILGMAPDMDAVMEMPKSVTARLNKKPSATKKASPIVKPVIRKTVTPKFTPNTQPVSGDKEEMLKRARKALNLAFTESQGDFEEEYRIVPANTGTTGQEIATR